MKKALFITIGFVLLSLTISIMAEDEVPLIDTENIQNSDQIVVYYLHMNRRCMTCGKLESYSKEAIEIGFPEQLKDSSILFVVENFEVEGNEHFADDYKLYSQSLILSRQHDGKETEWKNLNKIWELVGNKEEFVSYVQTQVKEFMNSKEPE